MQIGEQLQALRKSRKMSLTGLAKASGVQIATLSRMENNKMTGTLESHLQIARALDVDITEIYQSLHKKAPEPVTVENKFEVIDAPDGRVSLEILARQVSSKKMLPALLRIAGKTSASREQAPPLSEKFLFVLTGTIIVHIRDQAIKLKQNSSLYINAAHPHTLENPLATAAKVLCVTTPVTL